MNMLYYQVEQSGYASKIAIFDVYNIYNNGHRLIIIITRKNGAILL